MNNSQKSQQSLSDKQESNKTSQNMGKQNTQENKKIKFLVVNSQEAQPELDFNTIMKEKLNKYQQNLKSPKIEYKINRFGQNFPNVQILSCDSFFMEKGKEVQQEQYYDEILEKDKRIMKLSYAKIEIYDQNGAIIDTKNSYPFFKTIQSENIRYNQTFGIKDVKLLSSTGMFVTSNIVDSYAIYLNIKDEEDYFKLKVEDRKTYQRTIIFCSDYITNCSLNHETNEIKWKTLFYEQLVNFEAMQYQFWHIYQNIIFVVNLNFHWFIIKLDMVNKVMEIYDSLPKIPQQYEKLQQLMKTIFSEVMQKKIELRIKVIQDFPKQKDYYSCGYFACIALNYLSTKYSNIGLQIQGKQQQNFISKQDMKQILKTLLIETEDTEKMMMNQNINIQ